MAITNQGLEGFRDRLVRAFPPRPFDGVVSRHKECDEGIDLLRELPGKRWDEVPASFIDFNSGSLPLLEPAALQAFLPAWLLRSMETLADESVLAEFTLYFLCPGDEEEGWDVKRIEGRVALFDAAQRTVVREFLEAFLNPGDPDGWHSWATHGLEWW